MRCSKIFGETMKIALPVAVFLIFLLFVAYHARAGEAVVSWTPPTENTDGTPYTNPGGYRIFYWLQGQPEMAYEITDPAQTEQVLTNLDPGLWSFQMIAFNTNTVESARSETVSKQILPSTVPQAPVVTLTNSQVFTVVKGEDRFLLIPVGTVPGGIPCVADQYVNGYHVVPMANVTLTGTVKPVVVVARCE